MEIPSRRHFHRPNLKAAAILFKRCLVGGNPKVGADLADISVVIGSPAALHVFVSPELSQRQVAKTARQSPAQRFCDLDQQIATQAFLKVSAQVSAVILDFEPYCGVAT